MTFNGLEVRIRTLTMPAYVEGVTGGTLSAALYTVPSDVKAAFIFPDSLYYTCADISASMSVRIYRDADGALVKTLATKSGIQNPGARSYYFQPDFINGFGASQFNLANNGGWIYPGYSYKQFTVHPSAAMSVIASDIIVIEFL
jgi:hypothetical protein